MNAEERNLIAGLFERVRSAETAYRDPEADAFINDQILRQPHAPYAMAQTLIVQDQALEAAKARIDELERAQDGGRRGPPPPPQEGEPSPWSRRASDAMGAPAGYGGAAAGGGLFGRQGREGSQPYGAPAQAAQGRGGGFLSGALQTAAGVAGGALLFTGISSLFGGNEAKAGEAGEASKAAETDAAPDAGAAAAEPAASGEGGWFSGLLDGPGGDGQSPRNASDEGGRNDGGDDGDGGGDWL